MRYSIIDSMKSIYLLLLLLFLPVRCHAPVSNFSTIVLFIETTCARLHVDVDWTLVLFNSESPGMKGENVCEPKYKNRCVMAFQVPQILLKTAREFEPVTAEQLKNPFTAIRCAIKFLHRLDTIYHGNWQKIISHYKTGKSKYVSYYKILKIQHDEFQYKAQGGVL